MSSSSSITPAPAYAAPGTLTAPAAANFFVAAVILSLFVLAAVLGAERKDVTQGFDELTVRRVLRLVRMAEFKRKQAAPVLKVTSRAFGTGWRMPIARGGE